MYSYEKKLTVSFAVIPFTLLVTVTTMLDSIRRHLWLSLWQAHALSAYYTVQPIHEQHVARCGSTIPEAKALGCTFDLYSFTYYPPACFNEPLHKTFHATHRGDINWYYPNETVIDIEEVVKGANVELMTDSGYFHALHCTYEWERLILALAQGKPLDWKVSSYGHSWHCSMNFLKRFNERDGLKGTKTVVDFGQCGLSASDMYALGTHEPGKE